MAAVEAAIEPPENASCGVAALDAEGQTGLLFSLLQAHSGAGGDATAPPGLDAAILHGLQALFAMPHNRLLANRAHAEARRVAAVPGPAAAGAAIAEKAIVLVFNVIMEEPGYTAASYATAPLLAAGRAALLAALDRVGVYARSDPFPEVVRVRCDRRTGCAIRGAVLTPLGGRGWEVIAPQATVAGASSSSGGPYAGSGRCYALVQVIKDAIYGSVNLAHVVRVERTPPSMGGGGGGGGVELVWTDDRVAIKCISKAKLRQFQAKGGAAAANENPIKEVKCMSYVTRRMSGQLAGPETVRGDPRRVLPMVDCLEDDAHIYMVMPCLHAEMFDVVDERGGAFPEPEAFRFLAQVPLILPLAAFPLHIPISRHHPYHRSRISCPIPCSTSLPAPHVCMCLHACVRMLGGGRARGGALAGPGAPRREPREPHDRHALDPGGRRWRRHHRLGHGKTPCLKRNALF